MVLQAYEEARLFAGITGGDAEDGNSLAPLKC